MPSLAVKLDDEDDNKKDKEDGADTDEDEDEDDDQQKEVEPSKESLEKLAKLEPLPKLLADFDLDAHVGLIQRLLEEDPNLVEMQSKLSGKQKREKEGKSVYCNSVCMHFFYSITFILFYRWWST